MFYIILLFHVLIYTEIIIIYKKGLRKKSTILFLLNTITAITNSIKLSKTINLPYSTILELISKTTTDKILWLLLHILLIGYTIFSIQYATKKKKQNKILKYGIYLLCIYVSIVFGIILFSKKINFILLIISIIIEIKVIKEFMKTKKNYVLAFLILFSIMTFYNYCTYEGQARFELLLIGYPKEAYETGLEELKYYEEKNSKKYSPVQNIPLKENKIEIIEVKNYGIIKIAKRI